MTSGLNSMATDCILVENHAIEICWLPSQSFLANEFNHDFILNSNSFNMLMYRLLLKQTKSMYNEVLQIPLFLSSTDFSKEKERNSYIIPGDTVAILRNAGACFFETCHPFKHFIVRHFHAFQSFECHRFFFNTIQYVPLVSI